MDRRKHQFKVQNSGTPGEKDKKHSGAYKTELRTSEHLQQCQLSSVSPLARRNSNKHHLRPYCKQKLPAPFKSGEINYLGHRETLKFGIKCRRMSISHLSAKPELNKNLRILHGIGEPCLFSGNLEITLYLKYLQINIFETGFMLPQKQSASFHTLENIHLGLRICFNPFAYYLFLSQSSGKQHQKAMQLGRPYSILELCCLNKA